MDDVLNFFRESPESFTIYVVEQRFAVNRGYEYFKSFHGKDNHISTDAAMKKRINSLLRWMQKNIPNAAELVKGLFSVSSSPLSIIDVISSLSKLFGILEHQAVGPEVLDPIIIQEGDISEKHLTQIITLHKSSILQPVIIIILKDNNFERAKQLLVGCPHGINVKMIRNSGKTELYKVINPGAESVDAFLDAFSRQCFSSCSNTKRDILLNDEWVKASTVLRYAPMIFKVRSNLLLDAKKDAAQDIDYLLNDIQNASTSHSKSDEVIIQTFHCMCKLFRVYCHDYGGKDIADAYELALHLDNEILIAHVLRYAHFLPNISQQEKSELLIRAAKTFSKSNIEDHAIYCTNNFLTYQFYTDTLKINDFQEMQQEAVNNVPGLVGMSLIYNNTGVAHLYSGRPDEALEYFEKGLDYSRDRVIQRIALMVNILVAKDYSYIRIEENEYRRTMKYIFDACTPDYLPFLFANYIINTLTVCLKHEPDLAREFISCYPITKICQRALTPGQLGSGSLSRQIELLSTRYNLFDTIGIPVPSERSKLSGIREKFLEKNGCNPTIFNAWL